MLPLLEPAKRNLAYLFLLAGVIWLGVLYSTLSFLILWPAVACIVSFLLLKVMPGSRISGPWILASGLMGLVLSAYQSYADLTIMGGPFATIASLSLVAFIVFALYHLFLMYAGRGQPKEEE